MVILVDLVVAVLVDHLVLPHSGSGTANQGYAGGDGYRVGGVYSAGGQGGGAGAV